MNKIIVSGDGGRNVEELFHITTLTFVKHSRVLRGHVRNYSKDFDEIW